MLFNKENYPEIRTACKDHREIEFEAPREITAFSSSNAPVDWTAYPPALLPPKGYAQIFLHAGPDARGALTCLELLIHLDGGRILYKATKNNHVAMKVTWPNAKQA